MAVPNKSEWTSAFNVIFEELSERNLPATSFSSIESKNALQMTTKGEALFQCPKCPRYWGSSNGSIKFDYRLSINRGTKAGYGDVKLFAFGQKCQKCANCPFVPARFNGDSIDRALNILLLKVREKFYGDVTDELERFFNETSGKGHLSHLSDMPSMSLRCLQERYFIKSKSFKQTGCSFWLRSCA